MMGFFASILADVGCGLFPLDMFCRSFSALECPKFMQGGFFPPPPPPPALFAVLAMVCPVWDMLPVVVGVFVALAF